jgi:PhoD-like phosphatase
MPSLVLGPLLRHIGSTDATVWVETDGPCRVEVLGRSAPTFHVAGHHYAIVAVDGLEPGGSQDYEVHLDGDRAWPPPGSGLPPSRIRTVDPERPLMLMFGSCRVAHPHRPPYTLSPDEHPDGHGLDTLRAVALRMAAGDPEAWPAALLMIGDQVYADEVPPETLRFIRGRRSTDEPPGEEVADFEEYCRLYREAWGEEVVRWFLSTVSTAMLFDDHDVHDDWNISRAWQRRVRAAPWWEERIVGAFVSYWIYQHLGNLSPAALAGDRLLAEVQAADDAYPLLRDFARRSDRSPHGTRWSFCRDYGRVRVLGIDCRAGRVLDPERRHMVDEGEWEWIVERTRGDFDHILLGMSDPYLLPAGVHDLQAWNEATCHGAWGRRFEPLSERIREALDLDHWASFRASFERMTDLLVAVGQGHHGRAPATVVALSGDVHNAYLAQVAFRRGSGVETRVYQAVCSPVRNPLARSQRLAQRLAASHAGALVGRLLAAARVPRPSIRWRLVQGQSFANQLATLEVDGRRLLLRHERAVAGDDPASPRLETLFERRLGS